MDHAPLHNDHNVYILGAGFSAEHGFPLVSNFLGHMRNSLAWLEEQGRKREVEAIRSVLAFRQQAAAAAYRLRLNIENIEELFSLSSAEGDALKEHMSLAIAATLDFSPTQLQEHASALNIRSRFLESNPLSKSAWERATSDAPQFERFNVLGVDRKVAAMLGLLGFGPHNSQNTIITFNYDLLVEGALNRLNLGVDYAFKRASTAPIPAAGEGPVRLLKLHGSVNWRVQDGEVVEEDYPKIRDAGASPLLVPPTWHKEFGQGLALVWSAAKEALRRATRIIVMGFSMPTTDVHFRYLLAAGLRDNISLRSIHFVDPKRDTVRKRALQFLRVEMIEQGTLHFHRLCAAEALGPGARHQGCSFGRHIDYE